MAAETARLRPGHLPGRILPRAMNGARPAPVSLPAGTRCNVRMSVAEGLASIANVANGPYLSQVGAVRFQPDHGVFALRFVLRPDPRALVSRIGVGSRTLLSVLARWAGKTVPQDQHPSPLPPDPVGRAGCSPLPPDPEAHVTASPLPPDPLITGNVPAEDR